MVPVIDSTTAAVSGGLDLLSMIKSVLSIWSIAAANPATAIMGILGVTLIGGILLLVYKGWIKSKNQEFARVGEAVDRNTFIDREGAKTEERTNKDNAGREKLKDLPPP